MESYKSKETLEKLYWEKELTVTEMGERLDCGNSTISRWMDNHNIPTKSDYIPSKEELKSLYESGLSLSEIGEEYGYSTTSVWRWFKKYNLNTRKANHQKAPSFDTHPNTGYERWRHFLTNRQLLVRVHRLVAVSEFGFDEVCNMDVHHINEIPWDNRPSNLELMTHSEHTSHHKNDES